MFSKLCICEVFFTYVKKTLHMQSLHMQRKLCICKENFTYVKFSKLHICKLYTGKALKTLQPASFQNFTTFKFLLHTRLGKNSKRSGSEFAELAVQNSRAYEHALFLPTSNDPCEGTVFEKKLPTTSEWSNRKMYKPTELVREAQLRSSVCSSSTTLQKPCTKSKKLIAKQLCFSFKKIAVPNEWQQNGNSPTAKGTRTALHAHASRSWLL